MVIYANSGQNKLPLKEKKHIMKKIYSQKKTTVKLTKNTLIIVQKSFYKNFLNP